MLTKWLPLDQAEVKLITPESNDTVIDKEKAAFPNVEIHSWLSSYCELLFSSVETCGGTKTCGIALLNYEAIDERYRWKISLPFYPLSGEKVWQMVNHCKYFLRNLFCKVLFCFFWCVHFTLSSFLSISYQVRFWAWWMICSLVWVHPVLLLDGELETTLTLCYIQWSSSAWNLTVSTSKSAIAPCKQSNELPIYCGC